MKKSSNIIISVLLMIMGLVFFFTAGSLTNLFFAVCALGMLLMSLGEKVISRILMIIGAIGAMIFGFGSIISIIKYLI
ncbi:MAG: hypothetical protein IJW93_02670 [Clostridia bacterium]|nr:hypothetical protein [Clostridia bacterium]